MKHTPDDIHPGGEGHFDSKRPHDAFRFWAQRFATTTRFVTRSPRPESQRYDRFSGKKRRKCFGGADQSSVVRGKPITRDASHAWRLGITPSVNGIHSGQLTKDHTILNRVRKVSGCHFR